MVVLVHAAVYVGNEQIKIVHKFFFCVKKEEEWLSAMERYFVFYPSINYKIDFMQLQPFS